MFSEDQKQEIREIIRNELQEFLASDRYIFHKTVQWLDGRNIQFGKSNGTKIGTETGQKFAFHNSTPVAQRASGDQAVVDATGAITGAGVYGYSQNQANAIVTLLNEIRAALVEKGLIKGSA